MAIGGLLAGGSGALAASGPQLTAQYAVVVDADTGKVLFDKDMDTPAAPASLTKIFTAAVALSSASLDQELTVDSYDLVGESSMGLSAGQTVTLRTALYGMLLPSGNDAAMTVAQNLGALPGDTPQQSIDRFMARVNATAARLGLQHTHLVTPHGLDTPGHETTARDIAAISMFALRNPDFRTIIGSDTYHAEGFDLVQANRLLDSYPGLIGGKTGITDNAGYCLMEAAERDGHTIIAVVLKSTADAWYADASSLLDYGFDLLASGTLPPDLPTISLAPSAPLAPAVQQPAASAAPSTPTGLTVQRVSEHEVVVGHRDLVTVTHLSWHWPLAALVAMILATALALNYHLLIALAGLGWHHRPRPRRGSRGRSRPAHGAVRRHDRVPRPVMGGSQPLDQRTPRHVLDLSASEASRASRRSALSPAQSCMARGVSLVAAGNYPHATDQFLRALELDSSLDLARAPGFWSMGTAGYLAAARAYARLDRLADARSLLTIVKLGCASRRDLEALLQEVVVPSR
ncbi:MAG TPA: D-alanyl-D-alanine carboxypeptidase [Thermomicrobiaceae bacterium]|nr:D-alanyl-D-alanine carboxypeptidase [Thermomicrobiaceae bacterium]